MITSPSYQVVTGSDGYYQQALALEAPLSVKQYQAMANSDKYSAPRCNPDDIDKHYWSQLIKTTPLYGAEVDGTLFDDQCNIWNLSKLKSILNLVDEDYAMVSNTSKYFRVSSKYCLFSSFLSSSFSSILISIFIFFYQSLGGITTPYLYFGMWRSTFAWHTEDMDLYSINYLHFGAPKTWFAVPPCHARDLERLAAQNFRNSSEDCAAFLRHRNFIIHPDVLRKNSIPVHKIMQNPNEFIVTFPLGYHFGYNNDFNCAEATNFAMPRWVDYGKRASRCTCR